MRGLRPSSYTSEWSIPNQTPGDHRDCWTFVPAVGALPPRITSPGQLARVTSVVMLTMVGLAPPGYPLVGAAIGAWGAAPVFVGCGAFAGLGVTIALASDAVRRAEPPR